MIETKGEADINKTGAAVGIGYILFHGFIALLILVFGVGLAMAAL